MDSSSKSVSGRLASGHRSVKRIADRSLFESLEDRRLMSTYSYTVTVGSYQAGITTGHDVGTGSLAATAVSITDSSAPPLETVLQTALTQASTTLTAHHTATLNGSYSGSGTSTSRRLLFVLADDTGKYFPGTSSHEASLAEAKNLSGDYVLGFEDGTDYDYNDGYFLVTITDTTPPSAPMSIPLATPIFASTPIASADASVLG